MAAAAIVGSAVAAAPAAAARPAADLTVKRLSEPPATAVVGGKLKVVDRVANVGRRRARRTTVAYWLSKDRRRNVGDVRVGSRRQKPLGPRRVRRGRREVTLPPVVSGASYHLIACVDPRRKVRERREGNNCRASERRVKIALLDALVPPPPGGGTPAPQTSPDGGQTSPPPDESGDPAFPQAADPLAVTHVLQHDRATTRRIENYGGRVSATAADGTVYELTVPSGALVSAQDITLTPVQAVNGSPLSGGLVGAVQLEPHGLELLKAATLTIVPGGDAGPVEGQTGFLSHEAGEDFHLYPLDMGSGLALHLTHFSTPGVAQATDADRQVVLSHPPERHRAQYEQMMAEVLREARVAQLADANAALPADQIASILRGYYDDIVWPLVERAMTDDTVAAQAISELLSWARQVQLLSLETHPALQVRHDAVMDYVAAILRNAIVQGYDRCVNDHDLDYIVRLIGLARTGQLLGLDLGEDAWDKAQRCGSFKLDFASTITESRRGSTGEGSGISELDANWSVEARDLPIDITGIGTGTMQWAAFSYLQVLTYTCSDGGELRYEERGTATRPDNSITVMLGMDLNAREPGTPPPADRDIRLRLFGVNDIGESYETRATTWCGDTQPATTTADEERWRSHYDRLHVDEFLVGIRDWDLGTGDLIASKGYDRSLDGGELRELTRLELWHTPLE